MAYSDFDCSFLSARLRFKVQQFYDLMSFERELSWEGLIRIGNGNCMIVSGMNARAIKEMSTQEGGLDCDVTGCRGL